MKWSDIPKFNRSQRITMAALGCGSLRIGFKLDTGLFAFAAATVLVLLGCVEEKKAIKGIPWGTLILIVGVGLLVNVITELGGIA